MNSLYVIILLKIILMEDDQTMGNLM